MALSKERKEELVAQYADLLERSRAVILTEYTGLDVKQLQNLRAEVRKADGAYHVTKNTLLRHALEQAGRPVPDELLIGQVATGFALSEVPSLAKALVDFAKDQDLFAIKGAILGQELLSPEQVEDLANLPSLDELRGQLIGLILTPAQGIAAAVAGGVRQLVNVLDAYAKQEDASEATT